MGITTRFPPSPTGYLHIGGARTALYSWLHARQNEGSFVLRIEDTDRERSTDEAIQAITDGMSWLGLDYDEGPHYQTKRLERYQGVIQQLLDSDHAYHCYCSKKRLDEMREAQRAKGVKPKYDGLCRHSVNKVDGVEPVVRFKNPEAGAVIFKDLIKGSISISNEELDDLVIARPDGMPTYNLCVVVDDMDMGITQVIRGDDHINNTPRQINILKALGIDLPEYAHVPMIHGDDGKRLSKRHGAVGVMQYRDDGYLPEALLNYLVRLGWSHGDKELFSRQELLEYFRIEDVNRSVSTFNTDKLLWVNHEHMKAMDPAALVEAAIWHYQQQDINIEEHSNAGEVVGLIRERTATLKELVSQSLFFFKEFKSYDESAIKKNIREPSAELLTQVQQELESLTNWQAEDIHHVVQNIVAHNEVGFGKVAQPIRIAVTGSTQSPSIDQTLACLGRELTLKRIAAAITNFSARFAN
ncbi:MAG: glutamate--tRNA ligase [Arenicellaceae bacterium]|nr:glutamate--tRNA ligase [Arenicellaceae bacterium]